MRRVLLLMVFLLLTFALNANEKLTLRTKSPSERRKDDRDTKIVTKPNSGEFGEEQSAIDRSYFPLSEGDFVCKVSEKVINSETVIKNAAVPMCSLELPQGWKKENEELPDGILMIYIGDAKKEIIPTINVAWESCDLSSVNYLKISKKAHLEIPQTTCKEVGTLNCTAGKLHLLQIDRLTNWGKFRFLQGMIVRNGIAYVITGTASNEDFSTLSGQFFKTFQSFNTQ